MNNQFKTKQGLSIVFIIGSSAFLAILWSSLETRPVLSGNVLLAFLLEDCDLWTLSKRSESKNIRKAIVTNFLELLLNLFIIFKTPFPKLKNLIFFFFYLI